MTVRIVGIIALLSAAAHAAPPPAGDTLHGHPQLWLQASPEDPAEVALRETLARGTFSGPAATVSALRAISAAHPGTTASGLAQLEAGLLLLEAARPADAVSALRHPDVSHTALVDHAQDALGRALEASGDRMQAGAAYLAAAAAGPAGPLRCASLFRGADVLAKTGAGERAVLTLGRALAACPGQEPRALLRIAEVEYERREAKPAAEAYDHLDRDYPASPEAREGALRLASLAAFLPPTPVEARNARDLRKAMAVFEAGRYAEAAALLRSLLGRRCSREETDIAHIRLGRALLALGRLREAETQLAAVTAGSPYEAEAAFHQARIQSRRKRSTEPFESVAARFPDNAWAAEALLALANERQREARFSEALPYYRRLLDAFPGGPHVDRATWQVAWADYRGGRYESAAQALERAGLTRPDSSSAPGFLYWAGRARLEQGQAARARQLLEDVFLRFKHGYYGMRAREALALLPPAPPASPATLLPVPIEVGSEVPEPQLTRVRQLLLIDRLDEAADELGALPPTTATQATLAWIEYHRGRLRPAINAIKRAFPEYLGEAGDRLPEEVWRILYPIQFRQLLEARAANQGLDPALVAAIICQESTFNAGAVSRAGARGLMQLVPRTGYLLARSLRVPYRQRSLYDPAVSLTFGTRYLKQMLDRFEGRIERALAAYNAGPHRVDAWTAAHPDMSAEEFIESIPFTETRDYVMVVLAAQDHYRRLYSFQAAPSPSGGATASGVTASGVRQ